MSEEIIVKDLFGVKGIMRRYAKEVKHDLWAPLLTTLILLAIAKLFGVNSPLFMAESLNAGLVVIPVLLSVLVAGYVLLLTIYFSGNIETFKKDELGRDLLYQISANYAFCIINSIVALVLTIVLSFFFHLNIQIDHPGYVNYPCALAVYFFLFFTLKNLKDLVIALFNFGQSFIFEEQLKPKSVEQSEKKGKWYRKILKWIKEKRKSMRR